MFRDDVGGNHGPVQVPLAFVECSICHRYFGDASIRLHERHCEAKRLREEEEREAERRHSNRVIKQMPGVLCYICGRPFGRAGMVFHEPQCLAKWRRINAELPKRQRRPEPQRPENFMRPGMFTNRDVLTIVNGPTQALNVNNNPPAPHLVTPKPKPRTGKRVLRPRPRGSSASPAVNPRTTVTNNSQVSRATTPSPCMHRRHDSSISQSSSVRSTTTTTTTSKWLAPSM